MITMHKTPIRNQGNTTDIKMTAPRMDVSVPENVRSESVVTILFKEARGR